MNILSHRYVFNFTTVLTQFSFGTISYNIFWSYFISLNSLQIFPTFPLTQLHIVSLFSPSVKRKKKNGNQNKLLKNNNIKTNVTNINAKGTTRTWVNSVLSNNLWNSHTCQIFLQQIKMTSQIPWIWGHWTPIATFTMEPLDLRLRENHWRDGANIVRDRGLHSCCYVVFFRHERERTPMKSQQYGHLNNNYIMRTLICKSVWTGK